MSKSELNEKDLQGVSGGANLIYVETKKKSFWQKLLEFFKGKNKSDPVATTAARLQANGDIDLNKSPRAAIDDHLKNS